MVTIVYQNTPVSHESGDSLLDSLLRGGIEVPNGCRSGVCQSCLVQGEEGGDWSSAQKGLSDGQCAQNLLLACQCNPSHCTTDTQSLQIYPVDHVGIATQATVTGKRWLGGQILELTVNTGKPAIPGQYLTLWKDESLGRSYSVAACEQKQTDQFELRFHIRIYPDGVFSRWLVDECQLNDELRWRGPLGNCIYSGERGEPLLLAGTGTGLAPLWGVVNEAVKAGHEGSIDVILGARQASGLYFQNEFQELAMNTPNLNLHWIALEEGESTSGFSSHVIYANIYDYLADKFPSLSHHRIFLCGGESFVTKLRRQCFLAGAGMSAIKADAFLSANE